MTCQRFRIFYVKIWDYYGLVYSFIKEPDDDVIAFFLFVEAFSGNAICWLVLVVNPWIRKKCLSTSPCCVTLRALGGPAPACGEVLYPAFVPRPPSLFALLATILMALTSVVMVYGQPLKSDSISKHWFKRFSICGGYRLWDYPLGAPCNWLLYAVEIEQFDKSWVSSWALLIGMAIGFISSFRKP